MKILFASLLLILAFQISFGQDYQIDEDNWLGEMGYYQEFLRHIYPNKFYTKEDVVKAKEKFSLIKSSNSDDEWEGYYQRHGELNQYGLIWNSASGFIRYNIYTCAIELRGIWFGNIVNTSDAVTLNYEKPIHYFYPKKKVFNQENLIKVKIGEKHFLVPKSDLKDFFEYAAGRTSGQNSYEISSSYWWKFSDREKESSGLPILSEKYRNLVVLPVDAKITKIGKPTIYRTKNYEGKTEEVGFDHFITIDAGRSQNVKKGMELYIPELDETATVEKVFSTSSVASVFREFDDNKKEVCKGANFQEHPCSQISIGMSAKSISPF
jgi:hypothetical protein